MEGIPGSNVIIDGSLIRKTDEGETFLAFHCLVPIEKVLEDEKNRLEQPTNWKAFLTNNGIVLIDIDSFEVIDFGLQYGDVIFKAEQVNFRTPLTPLEIYQKEAGENLLAVSPTSLLQKVPESAGKRLLQFIAENYPNALLCYPSIDAEERIVAIGHREVPILVVEVPSDY